MRKFLIPLVAAGVAASVAGVAGGATPAPVTVALPHPTGPQPVGTTELHFTDQHRADPWVPSQKRQIMASAWYPARDVARYPLAHQFLPGAAAVFGKAAADSHHVPVGTVDWSATTTSGHVGAPPAPGRHPLVLYSAGLGDPRGWGTTITQELASRGYVVLTIDHTYEASAVEFPDGRVADNSAMLEEFQKTGDPIAILKKIMRARLQDDEYVLDHLPAGISRMIDPRHIGFLGHSGGGFEGLQLLHDDPRISAAADLDGIVGWDENDTGPGLSQLAREGVDKPFLLMGSSTNDHYTSTSWGALWKHSHGWHRDVHLRGSEHASYTDAEALIPRIAAQRKLPAQATADIGWIDPDRARLIQRTYLAAFFDQWLRGRPTGVFEHDRFPEASVLRPEFPPLPAARSRRLASLSSVDVTPSRLPPPPRDASACITASSGKLRAQHTSLVP
ncbi:MAG TPA: hypothetical protein VHC49_13475 [Mycobacteriales bacterium]|nr:hypothetical protein [Mycobacteriales bacterium]